MDISIWADFDLSGPSHDGAIHGEDEEQGGDNDIRNQRCDSHSLGAGGTSKGKLSWKGKIGDIHSHKGSREKTILFVKIEKLNNWQHNENGRIDDIDPKRTSTSIFRPKEDITQNIENDGDSLKENCEENNEPSVAGLSLIVSFHKFYSGQIEQIDENNRLYLM